MPVGDLAAVATGVAELARLKPGEQDDPLRPVALINDARPASVAARCWRTGAAVDLDFVRTDAASVEAYLKIVVPCLRALGLTLPEPMGEPPRP